MDFFALKGNIVTSIDKDNIKIFENKFLLCMDGKVCGIFKEIPEDIKVFDYTDKIIMPGMSDIHVHASQYMFRGIGSDLELLDWLNTYTFPEESKFIDEEYAKKAYSIFVNDLKKSGTTRVSAFATIHNKSTEILMDLLDKSGISGYVGKVSMDRNAPDFLLEKEALNELLDFIKIDKYENIKPILTPRFIPTCSDNLMKKIGEIQKNTKLPLQSHLSENLSEILWVKELCPSSLSYSDAYDRFETFGKHSKTIMAHCVHLDEDEIKLMLKRATFVAHCPSSNANLSSGIAPVKEFLEKGVKVGLGSDVAGGENISMFSVMREALKSSRLKWALGDKKYEPLNVSEVFYLATMGGGEFFGKVGSFLEGYEFDALVIDDSDLETTLELSVLDRIERMIYLCDERHIKEIYVKGKNISKLNK